jgi:hypothetical protein
MHAHWNWYGTSACLEFSSPLMLRLVAKPSRMARSPAQYQSFAIGTPSDHAVDINRWCCSAAGRGRTWDLLYRLGKFTLGHIESALYPRDVRARDK